MGKKKLKKRLILFCAVLLAIMLASVAGFVALCRYTAEEFPEEVPAPPTENLGQGFSCHTLDSNRRRIEGFFSDENSGWYLFLTPDMSPETAAVYMDAKCESASSGRLSADGTALYGAFSENGGSVSVTLADGSAVNLTVMQSGLPGVYVDLGAATLSDIHADKDAKFGGTNVFITRGGETVLAESGAEIKGRGNSTWREYEKKGYQIKFSEKISVLGMTAAKKWVLLANASDDSLMRTKLVSEAAKNMDMAFAPSFEYVDLWVEGEYLGTYLLGEKVEIAKGRLSLKDSQGALFEHDEDFYLEEEYWLISDLLDRHFTLKEIVTESDTQIDMAMTDFEAAVDGLGKLLYSTPPSELTLELLSGYIDVDSFAKYYIVNEYAQNRESFSTSFYWYKDGPEDVLHLGPIWDFDTCMGNDGATPTESYGSEHVLFRYLLASPHFRARTEELYARYCGELFAMTETVDAILAEISASAQMNYIRWDTLGSTNPKGGPDFSATYEIAVSSLKNWLSSREEGFAVENTEVVTGTVSPDNGFITLSIEDRGYSDVVFAIWNEKLGSEATQWYTAALSSDGKWCCTVNLGGFNSGGMYRVNAWGDGQTRLLGDGRNYVSAPCGEIFALETSLCDRCGAMNVTFENSFGDLAYGRVGFWSVEGEGEPVWVFCRREEDGTFRASVILSELGLSGNETLAIHAYGDRGAGETYLSETAVELPAGFAAADPDCQHLGCRSCGFVPEQGEYVPVYELWNPVSGGALFTASESERRIMVIRGWEDRGIAWYSLAELGVPVYRIYNGNANFWHYTSSMEEAALLISAGWKDQGVAWYSPAEGEPVMRLYNPETDSNTFAADGEKIAALEAEGWTVVGVAWNCLGDEN